MTEEQEEKHNVKIDSEATGQLPTLSITVSRTASDILMQQTTLTCCSWDIKEAKAGFKFLMDQLEKIKETVK